MKPGFSERDDRSFKAQGGVRDRELQRYDAYNQGPQERSSGRGGYRSGFRGGMNGPSGGRGGFREGTRGGHVRFNEPREDENRRFKPKSETNLGKNRYDEREVRSEIEDKIPVH